MMTNIKLCAKNRQHLIENDNFGHAFIKLCANNRQHLENDKFGHAFQPLVRGEKHSQRYHLTYLKCRNGYF